MTEAFQLFGQLAFELRDYIWKLGIRPSRNGDHIFTIYDRSELSDL